MFWVITGVIVLLGVLGILGLCFIGYLFICEILKTWNK